MLNSKDHILRPFSEDITRTIMIVSNIYRRVVQRATGWPKGEDRGHVQKEDGNIFGDTYEEQKEEGREKLRKDEDADRVRNREEVDEGPHEVEVEEEKGEQEEEEEEEGAEAEEEEEEEEQEEEEAEAEAEAEEAEAEGEAEKEQEKDLEIVLILTRREHRQNVYIWKKHKIFNR